MIRLIREDGPLLVALGVFYAVLVATNAINVSAAVLIFIVTAALVLLMRNKSERSLKSGQAALSIPPRSAQDTADAIAIIRHMQDPLILLNKANNVTFYNNAAQRLLGEGAQGRPLSSVLRAPSVLQAVQRAAQNTQAENVEYVQHVPVERHFTTNIVPVEFSTNADVSILIHLHDVTAMKRSEQMRADFVANASHELRTPLASLSGFIETLRGPARNDPDAQDRFLNIMQEQAGRMARLIHDLLSLSRIELNEHVPPETPISIADVVQRVVESMTPVAQKANVTLNVLPIPDNLPKVRGDQDELTQVLQNLVDNAIKYGQSGGRVELEVGSTHQGDQSKTVFARVHDFGEGIASEHLPRLTERFYRVNVTQGRESGGTGLGLAIVKHILNRHKGRLGMESTPGKGSSFTVHLPSA